MNNKENLINVSLELFSKHGFSAVSVRDICGALKLKESALYYHFKNKEAILTYLYEQVDELAEGMRQRFEQAFSIAKEVSTTEMAGVAQGFFVKYYCDNNIRRLISMLSIERMSDPVANEKYLKLMYEMPLEQCRKVFGQMEKRRLIKNGLTELAAQEYLGIITMAFDRYVLGATEVEQGILTGCSEIAKQVGIFYEEIRV